MRAERKKATRMFMPAQEKTTPPPPSGTIIICMPRRPKSEKGRPDIKWYKQALNRLGYYLPDAQTGITDDANEAAYRDSLYAFQRAYTLPFGDTPGPGSATERVLTDALAGMETSGRYLWRTAGDDKVRGEHGARAGKTFTWNNPPDDEHPGDDYNCRCWAEPVTPSQHPWAEWARNRQDDARNPQAEPPARLRPRTRPESRRPNPNPRNRRHHAGVPAGDTSGRSWRSRIGA